VGYYLHHQTKICEIAILKKYCHYVVTHESIIILFSVLWSFIIYVIFVVYLLYSQSFMIMVQSYQSAETSAPRLRIHDKIPPDVISSRHNPPFYDRIPTNAELDRSN